MWDLGPGVGHGVGARAARGREGLRGEMGRKGAQLGPLVRAAVPGPVCRPRDLAGSGPRGPGSSDAGPGLAGPTEGDITVGGAGHATPCPRTVTRRPVHGPCALEAGDRGDGLGGRAPGVVVECGRGEGVAGHGGDIWSFGRVGGRGGGAEGKRNIS